jgi:hypothetical protein
MKRQGDAAEAAQDPDGEIQMLAKISDYSLANAVMASRYCRSLPPT